MSSLRIVSLIASATEIVCALGYGGKLVGRSHECDYPEFVKRLPQVTETKFKTDATSREIDQSVKAILEQALSVYRVRPELLRTLNPDVIITQSQCEVCAVSLKDVEAAVCDWLHSPSKQVISLETNCLADLWVDIGRVAQALGNPVRGEMLTNDLKSKMDEIENKSLHGNIHPTVAYIEWIDPLMAGGNWMPELIEKARGINLFGVAGKHSPWMTWEELIAKDPHIIIVSPCGFDIPRTLSEMHLLSERPEWSSLRAVRADRVYVTDGNQYFNRPGPRLLDSLQILAEIIHPKLFTFGHQGHGWVRYEEKKSG